MVVSVVDILLAVLSINTMHIATKITVRACLVKEIHPVGNRGQAATA